MAQAARLCEQPKIEEPLNKKDLQKSEGLLQVLGIF